MVEHMTWLLSLAVSLALTDIGPPPPTPDLFFRAFANAIARQAWPMVAAHVRPGSKFPIGIEGPDRHERKTYTYEDVLAGKVPFPVCDDHYRCGTTSPTGKVGCYCRRDKDVAVFLFIVDDSPEPPSPLLLVSIQEKLGAWKPESP